MTAADLQRLRISDFSPGIKDRVLNTGGTFAPAPLGVASKQNTYRCIALPQGGLGPLPKRDYSLTYDALPTPIAQVANGYFINGFYVAGPVNAAVGTASGRVNEFFFGIEWINTTTPSREYRLRKLNAQVTPETWLALASATTANFNTLNQYQNTKFVTTRANRGTPANPGVPVIIAGWHAPGPLNPARIYQYPNDATPTLDTILTLFSDAQKPTRLFAHQGRLVIAEGINYSHGSVGAWLTNENLYWTVVNDSDSLESAIASVFVPENPAGYTAGMSMSANELFLVKGDRGGISVNGDLNDPTVINLPNIPSGFPCEGTNSPLGFIYAGTDGRLYAWAGGDSAQCISKDLDDFFFITAENPPFLDYKVVFDMWGSDYILSPNLFIMDTKGGGWWRLDNPADLRQGAWAMQAMGSHAYACMSSFTAIDQAIVYGWTFGTPALSYSWQSQPLWPTVDRVAVVRECILEAQGQGTVTVTVTGRGGETQTCTFTLTSITRPVRLRQNFNVSGQGLVVRIVADGGANPAPIVYAVDFGEKVRTRTPVGN